MESEEALRLAMRLRGKLNLGLRRSSLGGRRHVRPTPGGQFGTPVDTRGSEDRIRVVRALGLHKFPETSLPNSTRRRSGPLVGDNNTLA
jgi:hypothetical protein